MSEPRYHQQIEEARRAALALTESQSREFLELLEHYADEIALLVERGVATRAQRQILSELEQLVEELSRELARSAGAHIRLTAERVAEIHARATVGLVAAAGSTLAVGTAFTGVGARAAQAIFARPELAEAFVTIRQQGVRAVNRILRRGILRGAPAQAIAREIRQYIVAPGSLLEGDGSLLRDRRRIGYAAIQKLGYDPTPENLALVRKEASQIAYRASTIARTEIMQAEREAFVQSSAESPVVEFVRVALSYRHSEPCACEPIAEADLYGYGPGVYDPRTVPVRPHPRCWCWHRHILLPMHRWGEQRGPVPDLAVDLEGVGETFALSPSQLRGLMAAVGSARRAQRPERTLIPQETA